MTDADGEIFQHLEYFPFGETWVEESSNTQRTPYLFTGKELDEETQLYYFGARYYDPRTSVWQSSDPILASYLRGDRAGVGVFTPRNLGLYSYSHSNPVRMKDPTGEEPVIDWFDSQQRADEVNLGIALMNYAAADNILAEIESGKIDRAMGEVYARDQLELGNMAASRIGISRGLRIAGDVFDMLEIFGPVFGPAGLTGKVPTRAVGRAADDAASTLVPKATVALGKWGETRLAAFLQFAGRKPDAAFRTSRGLRYVDRLVDGIAHEAKAGVNVKLNSTYRAQILKDAELIRNGDIDGAVWHFFQGADQSIKDFLTQNGIRFIEH